MDQWMESLRDQCGPPLTPQRVMGALGGIVASRMAREFRFGGPSFVVSADAASGVKALQVAVDLLQQNTADAMLVGAVDLAAEGRSVVRMDHFLPLSPTNTVRPFDASADGTLPGDGAVALVLKPLAQARIDGNRIYAVIRGIGSAGGDNPSTGSVKAIDLLPLTVPMLQLERRLCRSLGVICGSPRRRYTGPGPHGDRRPCRFFQQSRPGPIRQRPSLWDPPNPSPGLRALPTAWHPWLKPHCACIIAFCHLLPALHGLPDLPEGLAKETNPFHMPDHAQHWYRDRERGPRTACCASITQDGNCSHVLIQEV